MSEPTTKYLLAKATLCRDLAIKQMSEGEGESKKPETYLVTFEVTSETDPAEWDWNELMDLGTRESLFVHSVGQITRNNQKEGE